MVFSKMRVAAALVALVAWAAEISFLIVNAVTFGSLPQAIGRSLSFLTDWSGLMVAIVCTVIAMGWRGASVPIWAATATVAIFVVGLMYGVLGGWAKLGAHSFNSAARVSDVLAHVATPWAMVLVWLLFLPHGALRWSAAPRFMLFPLVYLAQMFARGSLGGGYPYPQVDVPKVGWSAALEFAGAVTVLYLVLGILLVAIDRRIARRIATP